MGVRCLFYGMNCVVEFLPAGKSVHVNQGTLLINAAERLGLPVGQSCGRVALCGDCRMTILRGAEHLSPCNEKEIKLHGIEHYLPDERASCQAKVMGNVQVTATYW